MGEAKRRRMAGGGQLATSSDFAATVDRLFAEADQGTVERIRRYVFEFCSDPSVNVGIKGQRLDIQVSRPKGVMEDSERAVAFQIAVQVAVRGMCRDYPSQADDAVSLATEKLARLCERLTCLSAELSDLETGEIDFEESVRRAIRNVTVPHKRQGFVEFSTLHQEAGDEAEERVLAAARDRVHGVIDQLFRPAVEAGSQAA